MLFYGEKKMRMAQATPARMKGKSDGGETCAKCFELKMRIPIDYAFVLQRSQWPLRLLPP